MLPQRDSGYHVMVLVNNNIEARSPAAMADEGLQG